MKLLDFDRWLRGHVDLDEFASIDLSLNGIQVGDMSAEITKVAFAVDACQDTFSRAIAEGAELLFVHHGLFWGSPVPLTGVMGERIRFLMKNDLALYAVHLPLDKHGELGNNALIAKALGVKERLPFGSYKKKNIGWKGSLQEPLTMEEIVTTLFGAWEPRVSVLPFGPEKNHSIGIISGGAPREVSEAIADKLDVYITGDASHSIFHDCKEAGINVLFGGHYLTEIYGVRAMAQLVQEELSIDTTFIDIPTGY